jgi:hypothetical protein
MEIPQVLQLQSGLCSQHKITGSSMNGATKQHENEISFKVDKQWEILYCDFCLFHQLAARSFIA